MTARRGRGIRGLSSPGRPPGHGRRYRPLQLIALRFDVLSNVTLQKGGGGNPRMPEVGVAPLNTDSAHCPCCAAVLAVPGAGYACRARSNCIRLTGYSGTCGSVSFFAFTMY